MSMISGIYKIVNKVNGKYYIGSSKNIINYRWNQHKNLLLKNKHYNDYLQFAWNKYGKDNFDFIIVEKVPKLDLLIVEQKYLDIAQNEKEKCYNLIYTAGGGKVSEYSIQKIRNKLVGKNNPGFGKHPHNFGKHLSEETKRKISLSHIGIGKNHTEEAKRKISISKKNKYKGSENANYDSTIYIFKNKFTNEIFNGTRYELIHKYNLCSTGIYNLINHKLKSSKGWILIDQDIMNSFSKKFVQPEKLSPISSNPSLENATAPALP